MSAGLAIAACGAPTLPIPPPDRDPVDAAIPNDDTSPTDDTAPIDAQASEVEPLDAGAREASVTGPGGPGSPVNGGVDSR